jgi:trigger factor
MKTTVEKGEHCQATLTVEVEPAELEVALEKAFRRLSQKVKVPGFRLGKATRPLLERHVGKEALLEEALEKLVPELYNQALDAEKLDAVAQPEIDLMGVEPVKFKAIVPLKPVVTLGDYQNELRVESKPVQVTQEDVDAAVKSILSQKATLSPVDRPSSFGDSVTVDLLGKQNGETFVDQKNATLELFEGARVPMPGFYEQMVGLSSGQSKDFSLTFKEDFEDKQLAGKQYDFSVSVKEVKQKILPELNDEFVKALGGTDVSAWRANIENDLTKRAEENARHELEDKILTQLASKAQIDFPPVMLEEQINDLVNEEARGFGSGIKGLEAYLKSMNKTMEQHREELRDTARTRLVNGLVMQKVAAESKFEISEAEVAAEVERLVNSQKDNLDEWRRFWNLPQARRSIEAGMISSKTMDRLKEIASGKS